jgi:hypothetical protein
VLYVDCFRKCRAAIRSQDGHRDDLVLVGSVAPWNNQTAYEQNPSGDWVKYFQDIVTALGPNGCDGVTLHTYTHTASPDLIESEARQGAKGYQHLRREFRTYIDFMEAIPSNMRHLPVYITETDQDVAWEDKRDSVWVQRAYAEIDRWNKQPGNQQIRALILYRWPNVGGGDKWGISGKGEIVEDFRRAMRAPSGGYRWNPNVKPASPTKLRHGQQTFAAARVNIRQSPGHREKPQADVLGLVLPGTPATILAPAKEADGLTWGRVRTTVEGGTTVEGWMAQAANGVTLLSARR